MNLNGVRAVSVSFVALLTQPAKLSTAVVAGHMVASSILLDPNFAVRTLFCVLFDEKQLFLLQSFHACLTFFHVVCILINASLDAEPFLTMLVLQVVHAGTNLFVRRTVAVRAKLMRTSGALQSSDIAAFVNSKTLTTGGVWTDFEVTGNFQAVLEVRFLENLVSLRANFFDVVIVQRSTTTSSWTNELRFLYRTCHANILLQAGLAGHAADLHPEVLCVFMREDHVAFVSRLYIVTNRATMSQLLTTLVEIVEVVQVLLE